MLLCSKSGLVRFMVYSPDSHTVKSAKVFNGIILEFGYVGTITGPKEQQQPASVKVFIPGPD